MEPDVQHPIEEREAEQGLATADDRGSESIAPAPLEMGDGIQWVLIGPRGLRWGWSVALFLSVTFLAAGVIGAIAKYFVGAVHAQAGSFSALRLAVSEAVMVLALAVAGVVVAVVERRRLKDFNLGGPRGASHFFAGLRAGFAALSALVGLLSLGGWIHFGGVALSGAAIATNAAMWGICFFLVGAMEEGLFRCYLQATMTRGIDFWQALVINAVLCLIPMLTVKGHAAWGVYAMAIAGLLPCVWLFVKRVEGSAFWYATWVTSTLFGLVHTGNGGENWIGIFQAAFVGVVFCTSIRVTGSAWWAIGFHAAWDWAETYFYGTPDSGMVGQGHLLNTTAAGNPLWSGGASGPEGSVLTSVVLLLSIGWLVVRYGRSKRQLPASSC